MRGNDEAELARLMRAAIAGDERAYELFLHRTATLVRGYCRSRIARGGIDPEDIVQETLLAVHIKRHTWRPDSAVSPWLYGIVRYKMIDAFRRKGRSVEVDIAAMADTLAAPETEAVSDHDIARVLETLPAGQKAVVDSISVNGRSISETATELGMQETAVRVALHRGLTAIAKRFGRH